MIINSLLDTDLYKISMQQAVYFKFPETVVEYEFKCRSGENLSPYYDEIMEELKHWCSLTFQEYELDYLKRLPYIREEFITYLSTYKTKFEYIVSTKDPFTLKVKGPWLKTILFEVPVLAIINEVYFKHNGPNYTNLSDTDKQMNMLLTKLDICRKSGFSFADFGTRRRFSALWQKIVVKTCLKNKELGVNFTGTSNVLLAAMEGCKPIGTMAHEWLQSGQALDTIKNSQSFMLQKWADVYRGDLGIALTDTIGIESFLKDFDKYFAKLYDGVRQDSGDPFIICEKVIKHYEKLGIDPKTKTIVFSDSLNFVKAQKLYETFKDKINVTFGIGTNLTNDIPGIKPLSIVMKIQKVNGMCVAKISDEPEKAQCQDIEYLNFVKKEFGIK
ncbi:MAG: nicotinate phosphoribosyltransferase [Clostridia bacterium]